MSASSNGGITKGPMRMASAICTCVAWSSDGAMARSARAWRGLPWQPAQKSVKSRSPSLRSPAAGLTVGMSGPPSEADVGDQRLDLVLLAPADC